VKADHIETISPEINETGASYDRIKMQLSYRREIHDDQAARHDLVSSYR